MTSYNQYVAVKGAGRQASVVGPEWQAYKAKHADKVPWYSRAGSAPLYHLHARHANTRP